ncbi:MAG: YbaB/EbfC family nucleoid-associated protein [Myxococcaceae bacterium]
MPGVDLNYFLRQANKLTEKIEKRKTELSEESVTGQAGDGRVVATASGIQEITAVKIDAAVVDPSDVALLEDLVKAAVNAALAASREHMQKELAKVSGGLKIPGLTS